MRTIRLTALTLAMMLAALSASAEGYTKLTPEQAKAWWNSLTTEQQIQTIIDYDAQEHAVPNVPNPRYAAVLSGRDLHLLPQYADGLDYTTMTLGAWSYHIRWTPQTISDFAPPEPNLFRPFLIGAGVGSAVTVVAVVLILLLK